MVDKITSPIGANELIIKVNDVIDAIPTAVSQLDNDSGFITGITSSDVTNALGFTPYDSSNPDGYITSAAISSLTDVSLTNLSNGEGLIYNSTSGKWENTTISGGGGTASWGSITGTLSDQADLNTALEGKQATITGAASSITSNNLTGSRVVVSGTDGKVTVSAITTTKLGYLTDVTSNIQAQINSVSSAIPTSTTQLTNDSGYITGITSSMVTSALGYTPYDSSNPSGYEANTINTIKVNGTAQTVTSKTVDIAVPTSTTQLTNDSGFITGISSSDVTSALGYTPYDSSNPSGYISGITSSDVITALGYTPYNSNNPSGYQANVIETIKVNNTAQTVTSKSVNITVPTNTTQLVNGSGYITGITSSMVTSALGYTPYDSSNPSGYISGITSSMVTTALGFTPYSSANPSGYQANVIETVKVNGTALTPSSKAVNVTVPTDTSDLTNGAGFITSADMSGYQTTANLVTSVTSAGTDSEYPSAKAVYTATNTNASAISTIEGKIPSAATSSNQLADKAFVNSSISTNTAYFIGTFNSVAELEAYSGTLTNNDYAFVATTDTAGNTLYDRYKYNSSTSSWTFEYELNNSSFTSAQWSAINSGITSNSKITRSGTVAVGNSTTPVYVGTDGVVTTCAALNTAAYVANNTLVHLAGAETITGNKTFSGTVSLGSKAKATTPATSSNTTAVATTAFVKAQGYITGINSSDVTTALGFTPYSNANPSGYQANVIETIKVNGTAQTVTSKAVNITVPTSTTQLTNDSGFLTSISSTDVTSALGYTPYSDANPSGYISGITSSMVTTALGFTPYSSANPSGYQANVIETIKVNGTAQTVSSKAVDITVPTTTTAVTSGSTAALTSGGAYSSLVRLAGTQTITGNKTFSGTVSLGSSATATTPTVTSNDTTVATTKFVKDQGYQANVIETIKVNGTAQTVSSKAVNITVPTSTTQLTNDSGYITSITSSMVNATGVQTVQDIQPITSNTTTMSDTISMYSLEPSSSLNNLTFNYTGTADKSYTFELMLNMSSVQQVTFNNVHWLDGEIPDLSTTGVYFLAFRKVGNSSIWYGNLQGKWTP